MLLLTGGMLTGGTMLLLEGGRGGMLLLAGDMLLVLLLEGRGVWLVVGYLLLNTELLGVAGLGTAPGGPFITGGVGPVLRGGPP